MRIGELSARTGVSLRSLRYYEQQGLLTPARHTNGYREYSTFAEEQVRTIQFYLSLGLTTEQIAGFLQCVLKNEEAFCQEVLPIYEQKLAEIDEQGVTLVEFGATWCPPCKALLPILDELDQQYGERVNVVKVDCDDSPAIASEYRVMSMPTVIMFHNGEPVEKLVGLRPKNVYETLIERYAYSQ